MKEELAKHNAVAHVADAIKHALYTGSMFVAAGVAYKYYSTWYAVAALVVFLINAWYCWHYHNRFLAELAKC